MSTASLLPRLEGVRQTAEGRWVAKCAAHADRSPSLSIRELPDGRILLHCFGGCGVHDVMAAIGMTMTDLHPAPLGDFKRERQPFPAADVLRALGHEALVVLVAASTIQDGRPLNSDSLDRLTLAVRRIRESLDLAGVKYAS